MEISHVFHGAVSRKALFASCLNYNGATRLIYICDICPLTAYQKQVMTQQIPSIQHSDYIVLFQTHHCMQF